VAEHGAPDMGTALAAADEELTFAESCADHPEQTLVVIHRTLGEGGDIREQFRTVKAGLPFSKDSHSRVFTFHEVEGEDEPDERVDLADMIEKTMRDMNFGSPRVICCCNGMIQGISPSLTSF
jgi:hypothetical protein